MFKKLHSLGNAFTAGCSSQKVELAPCTRGSSGVGVQTEFATGTVTPLFKPALCTRGSSGVGVQTEIATGTVTPLFKPALLQSDFFQILLHLQFDFLQLGFDF